MSGDAAVCLASSFLWSDGRNSADLLHQAQGIPVGPLFHYLSAGEANDGDPVTPVFFPVGEREFRLRPLDSVGSTPPQKPDA